MEEPPFLVQVGEDGCHPPYLFLVIEYQEALSAAVVEVEQPRTTAAWSFALLQQPSDHHHRVVVALGTLAEEGLAERVG